MTLNEITTLSAKYADADKNTALDTLIDGINIAYTKICAEKHILTFVDTVVSGDMLTYKPNKIFIVRRMDNGRGLPFNVEGDNLNFNYDDKVEVLYSYIPDELKELTEVPKIPEQYHRALAYYGAYHYLTIDDDDGATKWLNLWNDSYDNIHPPTIRTKTVNVYGVIG